MSKRGSVSLGDAAAKGTHLDVACSRCERRGRYLLARLVARLGADYAMTDLSSKLANCPRREDPDFSKRCDVFFPNLIAIMDGGSPTPRSAAGNQFADDDY